ncbi:MAG: MATE family efflux transporter [Paracoccaceae bacterium]
MAAPVTTHRAEARRLLSIGLPLMGSNVAQVAIGLTDTVMMGRYGVDELAAMTIAGSVYHLAFFLGLGLAVGVAPLAAEALERGDDIRVRRVTRMAIWLSVVYGLGMMLPLWLSGAILRASGQEEVVAALGQDYLRIAGWALAPFLVAQVLRSLLSAVERTGIVLWSTVGAAVLNVPVNYALIFGNWGAPELGIRGAAIASLTVTLLGLAVLLVYVAITEARLTLFVRLWKFDWPAARDVLRIGAPIGLTTVAEGGLFSASAFMVGWVSAPALAAHGVALQLAALVFVIHLGLSQAVTVRAGQAMGRHDRAMLLRTARTAVVMSALIAACVVTVFLTIPEVLVSAFLDRDEPQREAILTLGVSLMLLAALFQTVDALQVIVLGLLRGVQDTAVPLGIAAVSYWIVGVPVGYALGFWLDLGAIGIWLGLVAGLTTAAVLLGARFVTFGVGAVERPARGTVV